MRKPKATVNTHSRRPLVLVALGVLVISGLVFYLANYSGLFTHTYSIAGVEQVFVKDKEVLPPLPPIDIEDYDARNLALAHRSATTTTATSTATTTPKKYLWPVKGPYPLSGAILPFKRIFAYYGNYYSKQMGILGEFPEDQVLEKMRAEIARWEAADPKTPVMPAIEYIAVTAQASAGADGKYRLRMPHTQIDRALSMAQKVDGIVILDVQNGLSPLQSEIKSLEKYLSMPTVHLAIDPEFSMKTGARPGTVIGSVDADDINNATMYLADLVKKNNLPPKVLIVHRFTQPMVKRYKEIILRPEVQIVVVMDGWGSPIRKIGTYQAFIYPEPVQFTGLKIFYKNDMRPPSDALLTPAQVLKLTPSPIYIQYQ